MLPSVPSTVPSAPSGAPSAGLGGDGRRARSRRGPVSRARGWQRAISLVVAIGLWQAASSSGLLPASKLASPASIGHTAYELVVHNSPAYGTLQGSLLASLERWAIGFTLGIAIAVLLAIVTGLSRVCETILDPILQALRSVPLLGLIPLFIVWFGIGQLPKVLFVLLSALFPMYLNTFAGIRGGAAAARRC